jgi:GNAT superfamily N-acetyltransferase
VGVVASGESHPTRARQCSAVTNVWRWMRGGSRRRDRCSDHVPPPAATTRPSSRDVIQEPDPDGLAEWFERGIAEGRDENTLWLVATADGPDGRVVGMIEASVQRPHPDGHWQLQGGQSRTRLLINALAVAQDDRRHGVGTLLMNATEAWARSNGATVALTDTNLHSKGHTSPRRHADRVSPRCPKGQVMDNSNENWSSYLRTYKISVRLGG